ncbi:hypothetical protein OL233_06465 [Vagococcus sp. PNs007]|uniref:Uncharacterized protein n=1 Tax=Vagococcus proximus TaxID=2991417 RepID=A0ABT5X1R5_9ENTE|nr:hypothetical protein [Vagococcus proximus]MDF0479932.1 hypothetical protein [Vagococcus proximus]
MSHTKNNQAIKEITHQDIYELHDTWEQLQSWQEVLVVLGKFFEDESRPVNKQQLAKKYYASSRVFQVFYTDFNQTMERMEKQIVELRRKKKI